MLAQDHGFGGTLIPQKYMTALGFTTQRKPMIEVPIFLSPTVPTVVMSQALVFAALYPILQIGIAPPVDCD